MELQQQNQHGTNTEMNVYVYHCNRKEDPELNLQRWSHPILGKDGKNRHWK